MRNPDSIVYLNGQFLPKADAKLDLEDRGAMFADGVYEVTRYYAGQPFAIQGHVARLRRSLDLLRIAHPAAIDRIADLSNELLDRNGMKDAIAYWQVTRGSAPRKHPFPQDCQPTFFMIAYHALPFDPSAPPPERSVILHEDLRWQLCTIKSLMLLPNVLAKQKAEEQGAYEAILHRGDIITEATATSVGIVRGGEVWTHPANNLILGSITRGLVLDLARGAGITVREETFTVDELLKADEVFIMGTTTHVSPVVSVDGKAVGGGRCGPVSLRLQGLLVMAIREACAI
ncbi:MAG: aminotransferase class IV, partial [Phycisphaeraceae bacterium]